MNNEPLSIVMMGATGAVGSCVVENLLKNTSVQKLTLLGRRPLERISSPLVEQHTIDIFTPRSYQTFIAEQSIAICTLGVGEPSKVSKDDLVKIDKTAVIEFAKLCKQSGVQHFQLLNSVASNPRSFSFFLRTKGELIDELEALDFERLSIFQPSMILTPTNRYGFSQAMILLLWPLLKPVLIFNLRKYRGIPIEQLGSAIAQNTFTKGTGLEILHWDDFISLAK